MKNKGCHADYAIPEDHWHCETTQDEWLQVVTLQDKAGMTWKVWDIIKEYHKKNRVFGHMPWVLRKTDEEFHPDCIDQVWGSGHKSIMTSEEYGWTQIVEDNAPRHKGVANRVREECDMDCLPWSPQSPDLNLIEALWTEIENELREIHE
ncbi:hypothetical protein L873DRAFT_1845112 [Choiromyces venosus 120613-1]|uniref:Tc1-like transposase DDE domain-containing protein n=1 Tax=Choiromyces venosus 120613-1 TaxID=1336337 RepID=A0A3N4JIC5_9PEZI|nr:hypothetical protein L873DRAFT_1845112 [Choiromyces venosus 120613-1]